MPVSEQIAVLYCGVHNMLAKVPLDRVQEFEALFLDVMRTRHKVDVLDVLATGVIDDNVAQIIENVANEITATLI